MNVGVLVVGSGAMACLFAARLAASGQPVTMLGSWPEGLQALSEFGVRLVEESGEQRACAVRAISDPACCRGASLALVLVKSWQTQRAAQQLKTCLAPGGLALSLQNGLGNLETLAAVLGEQRASAGTTTYGATLVQPGMVRARGSGEVALADSPQLASVADLLLAAGFRVRRLKDLNSLLWAKLAINSAINPLTALLDCLNGELLAHPSAMALAHSLAEETAAVASSLHIRLPFEAPAATLQQVLRATAQNSSSMRQDLQRGAPTEVDAINGAVVRHAGQSGAPAPYNRAMWLLLKTRAGFSKEIRKVNA